MRFTSALFVFLFLFAPGFAVRAAEPSLKPNDVIALVGGEDMVAASEYGYLELLLTRALPGYKLKFRCLAWEGDTVFEQRRDMNFPSWQQQLDQIGATVVICEFGQMESLAGKEKLPDFIAAYERLAKLMSGEGARRIFIVAPPEFSMDRNGPTSASARLQRANDTLDEQYDLIESMCKRNGWMLVPSTAFELSDGSRQRRDSAHLTESGHLGAAMIFALKCDLEGRISFASAADRGALLRSIREKNRLWFHYWRVQNWAFLAGDRTNQPSSRDHIDREKRWFPAEREEFLPLIAAREQEIWALAERIAQP